MLQNGETVKMRKASREMDAAFALEVLDKAPYVTISFTRPNGTPYGVPLSLARTDDKTFYFHCALEYFIAGLIQMITIIGIPFGLQSLKLGMLAIWPFGTKVKWRESQPGCLSIFMNVLWFFVGGIWIWLTHIFYGLIFCITIIGIPFGKMHFRLAKLALSPFGKELG